MKNTDKVPVDVAVVNAFEKARYEEYTPIVRSLEAAINASPELTALIAENERLTLDNERMREALTHLSEDNYYTEECRRIAKQALGEKSKSVQETMAKAKNDYDDWPDTKKETFEKIYAVSSGTGE